MVLQFSFSLSIFDLWIRNIVMNFRLILNYMHPTSIVALTTLGRKTFNRLVIHVDSAIMTYSLDILARLALDKSQPQSLDASIERIGGNDLNIVLCRHVHSNKRVLCEYIFEYIEHVEFIVTSSDIWIEAAVRVVCDVACGRGT